MRSKPKLCTDGFSLLEVLVALVILATAAMALMGAQWIGSMERESSRERQIAQSLLTSVIEDMRERSPEVIRSLAPPYLPSAGALGQLQNANLSFVRIPDEAGLQGTADGGALALTLSAQDQQALGFPLDLNADGDTADGQLTHACELRLLPAKISLSWTSRSSGDPRHLESYVYFSAH